MMSIHGEENLRIKSAEKFFETLKNEGINVSFTKQLKHDDIKALIANIVDNKG